MGSKAKVEGVLKELWYRKEGGPGAFTGPRKLYEAAKNELPDIRHSEVQSWLNKQKSYVLFKQAAKITRVKRGHVKKIFHVFGKDRIWSMDIMYLPKMFTVYKFILTKVDAFSKMMSLIPMAKLDSERTANAFDRIVEENDNVLPKSVFVDRGTEFFGIFQQKMNQLGIKQYFTKEQNVNKSIFAENAHRFIRLQLGRIFESGVTRNI